MRNSGKSLLGLVIEHEEAKAGNRCPACFLSWAGWGKARPLNGLKVGERRAMGWVRGLASMVCHPSGSSVCRYGAQYPALACHTSELAVGFLVFLYVVHNLSQLCMYTVIFSSLQFFFVVYCLRRHLSRYKNCSEGSQVPVSSLSQLCH